MQATTRARRDGTWLAALGGAVALLASAPARADLDVVFALDTTGSMSGELREVKERVVQIADALRAGRPQERVRLGVVAYRDRGDDYVTRISPLTDDVATSQRFLAALVAGGGGDGPEDVLAALRASLVEIAWDPGADTERQVFLIGDAPPHLDYADHPTPEELVALAHRHQVSIHTIGCRSLPAEGVAFFRRVAYQTEGSYQHIGRIRTATGGVAEAMLRTLAREPEAPPRSPVAATEVEARVERTAPGLLVHHGGLDGAHDRRTGAPCSVSVLLPEGTDLVEAPRFEASERDLLVQLRLGQGAGGGRTYLLERCLPITTPIAVEIGG